MTRFQGAAVIALVAILALQGVSVAQRGQVATSQAVLTTMYGDVQTRHGTAGYHPAKRNEVLTPGDAVKTGANSRAELSIGEGGYVRMDENSQVLVTAIDEDGRTTFETIVGGLWVTIERALGGVSKFEVRMPSAIASATGTVFRCHVDEDGESETYVYEGAVEVNVGDRSLHVEPEHRCRVPRDLRAAVERFSLTGDDESAWVMYNRHRDIVRHLGNPSIVVGLREHNMPEEGVFAASRAIAGQLALHGLQSSSIEDLEGGEYSFDPDGSIRWRRTPGADYCVIGDVTLEQLRRVNEHLFSARVRGNIRLVRDGESEVLTSIEALVPGVGRDQKQAVGAALFSLGKRVGAGLAPRVIRELMQAQMGTVRIDLSGATRAQVAQVRHAVAGMQGVLRTAPLVLPGDRISLAVVTQLSPDQLAATIERRVGDQLEGLLAGERVLFVRFTPTPAADSQARERPEARERPPAGTKATPPPSAPRRPTHLRGPERPWRPGVRQPRTDR
ncbi:MAG: FecR family protein [Armatimonadota bacterium]